MVFAGQRPGIALVILVLVSRGVKAQSEDPAATGRLQVVDLAIERNQAIAFRLVVNEGEPVRATDVVFTGFDVLPPDQLNALRKTVPLQPGDVVALPEVQETTRQAVNALRNAGYAYPRVEVLETMVAPDRVRIELKAEPGLQAVFGPIEIVGNVSVPDPVIRRQLAYFPGQRFQTAAMEESQRRLQRLELFDTVDIELVGQDTASGVATCVIVKERDHTQFTYAFGYSSEERAYGDAEWRHANFLGGARTFSARGRWSWLDRGVEAAFIQPYLLRPNLTFAVRGYVWDIDNRPYEALSSGGRAGLTYELGRTTLTGTYIHAFENVRIPGDTELDPQSRVRLLPLGLDATNGEQEGLLSALQFAATRDATVQSEGIVSGYRVSARLEQAGSWLPGAFNYRSLSGDARYYHAVARVTLAGRLQYGSINPSGPKSDVPFSRRYFLGGAESLRGWGRFEVSPYAASLPLGGQSLLATTGEIRFPVAGPVGAVVFVDAGNVWEDAWALSLDLHSDAGLGVRYRSRFGLLRLDFAHQLTTVHGLRVDGQPQDRRWRVHFAIGHAF